jgi:DNA-directed RNA polymerase specialized sigma24 family protein
LGSGTATGDDDFDTYFRTVYAPIVRALATVYGDAEAAAVATQDAFQDAYVRWHRVRRADSPVAWIRREAIRRLDGGAGRPLGNEPTPGNEPAPGDEPAPGFAAALAALAVPVRTAVVLTCLDDLPEVEVARSMGITEAAVRAHLDRGLTALAAALDSRREGPDR